MKRVRKLCAILLNTSMILGSTCYAAEIIENSQPAEIVLTEENESTDISDENIVTKDMIASDIAHLDEMLPTEKKDLPKHKQQIVDEIISVSMTDALSAAESLNQISDQNTYEAALHEILNSYYAEDSSLKEEQVAIFSEAVDDRADKILANYAEAKAERDNQENLDYETGKVVVVFKAGTTDEEIAEIAERIGKEYYIISDFDIDETLPEDKLKRLKTCGTQEFPKVVSIYIDLDKTVSRAETMLEALSCVTSASENNIIIEDASIQSELGVNDPDVNKQYHLHRINAPEAWQSWNRSGLDIDYNQVWVAVIDSGLDINHPDLKNMYIPERSVVIGRSDSESVEKMDETNCYWSTIDKPNHGTHVAGILAAQSNNNTGIVGVASIFDKTGDDGFSECRIIAINPSHLELNEEKQLICRYYDDDLATAIYHAVNNGAEVINMSVGGRGKTQVLKKAIDYAYEKNVIICAAAGNAHFNEKTGSYEGLEGPIYPASYDHVVSVANLDSKNKRRASSIYNSAVDLAAPGTDIYSCILNFKKGVGSQVNGYDYNTGTSMATPIVSAGMALIRAILPDAAADEVESVLNSTATDLYSTGKDIYTGFGLINLELAVETAKKKRLNATSPQDFRAAPVKYQTVRLSWEQVEWAEQYVVYRSTSIDGPYEKIKHVRSTDVDSMPYERWVFKDNTCDTGTTYYYKVRAASAYKDAFAYSHFSPIISAKCTLDAPDGLTLTAAKGKITSKWNKVSGATGYRIFRATSKTGTYTRIKSIANGDTLSYADTSVTAGKTYYYKVRAYRTVNGKDILSDFSTIVGKKAQ